MGLIAMDHLPSEMVEEIASYLTIEDVVACSRVSVKWDEAFNVPGVWRRFVTLDPKYFEKKSSTQNFSLDKIIQNQGDPCKFKELALKEFFIKDNFLSGKHHVEEIDLGNKYIDCVKEWVDAEGNHWLFVSLTDHVFKLRLSKSNHEIQVWNINQIPVLHSCSVTPPICEPLATIGSKFKVTHDRLIYLQYNLVLLYEFAPPQYELKFLTHVYSTLFRNFNIPTNMIYLPGIIIGFAYTFQHWCIDLNPCYEVWNQIGIHITTNFEEEVYHQDPFLEFIRRPDLLIKRNHFNKLILSCNYNDGDCKWFKFKIFDGNDYQFTNISFTKRGRVQDFNVSANFVTYITLTHNNEYYVGHFNVDNGHELRYLSLNPTINNSKQTRLVLGGNSWLVTINKKTVSFYMLHNYITPLQLDSTFKFIKNYDTFYALTRNFAVVPSFDKDKGYNLFHFKTGKNTCKINLPVLQGCLPFGDRCAYFYYKKKNQVPTRFIVYPNPPYFDVESKTCISLVNFW